MLELTDIFDTHDFPATPNAAGKRLDVYLSIRFRDYSRTILQQLCRDGRVKVAGQIAKPSRKLELGEQIVIELPRIRVFKPTAEDIPINIVYEDEYLIAVNKEAGMIVHPARGHKEGTLVNALLHHAGVDLPDAGDDVPRPGIVHRLDRYTSGIMVLAKRSGSYENLAQQFEYRQTRKEYIAIVAGTMEFDTGYVEEPIGRSLVHREKMAIRNDGTGKEASTYYEVEQRFRGYTLVRCFPKTGRTHQIRVHLAHIGHPCLVDAFYGSKHPITLQTLDPQLPVDPEAPPLLDRHALHAHKLEITHPSTGERLTFEAPLADDLQRTVDALRTHRKLKP